MKKSILVTGGAGFLGSHLCEFLINKGHEIICVDNYYTGFKENITHLLDNHNFELYRHDITFPLYIEADEEFRGPVNLGNPQEFTIKELAEKIIILTNSTSKIIQMPLPVDDPVKRQPDISLVKKKLNWSPKVDLDEGLIKTIDYFKKISNTL